MFRANIELELRMLESAEDITAAETAPRPMKETHCIEQDAMSFKVFHDGLIDEDIKPAG